MAVVVDPAGFRKSTLVAPTLSDLQNAVGGFIEILALDAQHLMIVNDDHTTLDLPVNSVATIMASHVLNEGEAISGMAVFLTRNEIEARRSAAAILPSEQRSFHPES